MVSRDNLGCGLESDCSRSTVQQANFCTAPSSPLRLWSDNCCTWDLTRVRPLSPCTAWFVYSSSIVQCFHALPWYWRLWQRRATPCLLHTATLSSKSGCRGSASPRSPFWSSCAPSTHVLLPISSLVLSSIRFAPHAL